MGIAIQALIRTSPVRYAVAVMFLISIGVMLWRAATGRSGWWGVGGYGASVLVLLALFWPEVLILRQKGRVTEPSQVASYAAMQDEEAQVVTADDTQQVPEALRPAALVPPGLRLLLRIVTETFLALARMINDQTHRTFASLMPMSWLLGMDLTADVTSAVSDWTHSCYLPILTTTMAGAQGRTVEELLPWGERSLIAEELTRREVTPGSQTGITWLRGPTTGNVVRCDVYLAAVEFRAQAWLSELRSPRGTPLLEVFQEELGLDAAQQSRFLIYRELLRAAGPAVPAPSLTGQYAALRGLSVAGKAADVGSMTGVIGWLSGAFSAGMTLFGAGRGAASGLAAEFQRAIDGLSWLVGLAVFLTWWGPYIVGLINLVLLALFPFLFLWAMLPGNQLQPIALYVAALVFSNSSPLWWALADQGAKLAQATAPQSQDLLLGLGNGAVAFGWSTLVMVLAVLIIPGVSALMFFGRLLSLGSAWRGAV